MANSRHTGSSDLFQPLTGEENLLRLESKFDNYLDSDDETRTDCLSNISQSNLRTSSSMQWLNSQKGTSSIIRANNRVQQKRKRSNRHGSCEKEKSIAAPDTAKGKKEDAIFNQRLQMDRSLRDDMNDNSSIQDTEQIVEWSTDISKHVAGVPESNTERPKLTITPVSDKVAYKLSTDDVQPPVTVPATINQYLRDYQREGIRFLYLHYLAKTGAILGDDMGLGKTIQVIGLLAALLGKQGTQIDTLHSIPKFIRQMSDDIPNSPPRPAEKPFLIIGPSAVMYNWLDELKTWGYFSASKFHGAEKETCLNKLKKGKLEIVVTTFETFRDNMITLNQVQWEAVIVDEVHKIKGMKAQITQALRTVQTPCRFGLTGTVLQNNMAELWSLFDWVQPGVLGTLEQFETDYMQVIENGQRHDATKRELAQARKRKDAFSEIRKKLLLRRTKALIADQLPSKEDMVVMCRLTELQTSMYKAVLSHPDMQLVLCAEDPCDCRSGKARASCCYKKSSSGIKAWALVFTFMHLLLKAANHMALLIPDKTTKEKQASLARSVCDVAFQDFPQFIAQSKAAVFRTLSDPKYCGKMKVLQGLLSAFNACHDKVLIFSYSTRLLDIIEQYVISQGHVYQRIDGKTSSRHRQDIVKKFNSDSSIFLCLISTNFDLWPKVHYEALWHVRVVCDRENHPLEWAGGLGLNLTGANRVVIFDPNWNPSHDLQAQDRAYRIGQTRDVKVYRLVSAGTIEENIYLRQIYKQQLDEVVIGMANARRYFHGIRGDKGNCGELFGIKNMFSLRTGNSCLTMDILKRNDKIERGLAGYDITHYVPPNQSLATDLTEDDSDGSEQNGRYSLSSDEDEDEEFLRNLFGSERSLDVDLQQQDAEQFHSVSFDNCKHPNRPEDVAIDSDGDEDQFSLIPNLYKRPQHQACSTEITRPPEPGISSSSNKRDGLTNPEAVSFTSITFSSRKYKPSGDFQKILERPERKHHGAVSGLSWLFNDSEDDCNDDDDDDRDDSKEPFQKEGPGANKSLTCLKKEKCKTNISAAAHPVNSKCSNSAVGLDFNSGKNISMKEQKGDTESDTSAEMKAGTSKEIVSLEELVLRSSDVIHTHANAKVVGPSRAEDHMTHCAMHDVFELHTNSQAPAVQCNPYSQNKKGRAKLRGHNTIVKCDSSGSYLLVGQTPASFKRQHWSELCESLNMDQLTLANVLLNADVKQRLGMLREFYSKKYPQMVDEVRKVFGVEQIDQPPEKYYTTDRARMSHGSKKIYPSHKDKSAAQDVPLVSTSSDLSGRKESSSGQADDFTSAFPSGIQDFSDDKSDSHYLMPLSVSRKRNTPAIVRTLKSTTRLRNKRQIDPDANTRNHNKYGRYMKARDQYSLTETLLCSGSLGSHDKVESITGITHNSTLTERNGYFSNIGDCKKPATPQTATVVSGPDNPHMEVTASKVESCTKADVANSKHVHSGPKNIACIMDDIFSCLEKHAEKQDSPTKSEFCGENIHKHSNLNTKTEKSKPSDPSNHSIRLTSESLFSEGDTPFDDLFKINTLQNDNIDSVRLSKTRNFGKIDTEVSSGKRIRGDATEQRLVDTDIDDLSWCKFDKHVSSSDSEDGPDTVFIK